MTSEKNNISQNFDSFLKEENIEINEEEMRERIKDKCMEFLQIKLNPTSEHYLKEQIEGVLKEAYDKGVIIPNYKVKRTKKLPRKLKKKYKKEQKICFEVEYKKPIYKYKITIPIEESEG